MGKRNDISREFEIHFSRRVERVKFSRDEKHLVSLLKKTKQYALSIYDIQNSKEVAQIKLAKEPEDFECFENSGIHYVLTCFMGDLYLWNINSGEECGHIGVNVPNSLVTRIQDYALSWDGTYVGYIATDKTKSFGNSTFSRIYNLKDGTKIYEAKHRKAIEGVIAISPNNRLIALILDEGQGLTFQFLRLEQGDRLVLQEKVDSLVESSLMGSIHDAKFHPEGDRIFISRNKKILVYHLKTKRIEECLDFINKVYFEFNHNGGRFLVKSSAGIGLFDSDTGRVVMDITKEFEDPNGDRSIQSVNLGPVSNLLLLCYRDGGVRSIDLDAYEGDALFQLDDDPSSQIKFRKYTEAKKLKVLHRVLLTLCFGFMLFYMLAVYYGW